jgi:hypothetical protein
VALWLPSHSGGVAVFLQTQNHTVPVSTAVYFSGDESVPLCVPSQKGCRRLRPQRHHQYTFPASTSIAIGFIHPMLAGSHA